MNKSFCRRFAVTLPKTNGHLVESVSSLARLNRQATDWSRTGKFKMQVFRIEGGRSLQGEVDVPGSKNASLAILSAVPLASEPVTLTRVPDISDIRIKLEMLREWGAEIEWDGDSVTIDCSTLSYTKPAAPIVRPIRTSFYLLGPLVARLGKATLPMPGGCLIGARPVDFHIKGLKILGAEISQSEGAYIAETDGLKGGEIYLDFPSAGATQHLMSAGTLADGITTIRNAAVEPEVTTLADFLNRMGARIEGAGTSTLTIHGVSKLGGCTYPIPADRMQAATYLMAAAITKGDVKVNHILPEHQNATMNKLLEAGAKVDEGPDWVRVRCDQRLKGIRVRTMPYPGFPTDIQQPMAAVLTLAKGTSVVEETIYESRIGHVAELNRMGANVKVEGRSTLIEGVGSLDGSVVQATDLRAGAALCLAGLAAEGETIVENIHFIDRGYANMAEIVRSLGGVMERLERDTTDSESGSRIQSRS